MLSHRHPTEAVQASSAPVVRDGEKLTVIPMGIPFSCRRAPGSWKAEESAEKNGLYLTFYFIGVY